MNATIIKADGTETPVTPKNGSDFQLDELSSIVGGYIEIVEAKDGRIIVLDEEGKLKGKRINAKATMIQKYGAHDPIVGDVLVTDPSLVK